MAKLPVEYMIHGIDGSIFYEDPNLGRPVWLRVTADKKGRFSVTDMHWPGDMPIKSEDLRRVPIGAVEAFANLPDIAEDIRNDMGETLRPLAEIAKDEPGPIASAFSPAARKRTAIKRAQALKAPDERPYPNKFFIDVTKVYLDLALSVSNPAALIAEHSGYPISSVHGWLKEARKREILPPSRQRSSAPQE